MQQLDPRLKTKLDRFEVLATRVFDGTLTLREDVEFSALAMLVGVAISEGHMPADYFDKHWIDRLLVAKREWNAATKREIYAADAAATAHASAEQGARQWN